MTVGTALRIAWSALALGLVACSGGGGGAGAPPPVSPSTGTLEFLAGNFRGPGNADGVGPAASFNMPMALTIDSGGNVYVADTGNSTIRKITPAREVTTFAGSAIAPGNADGVGSTARFLRPAGIAVDPAGNLYVADTGNSTIRRVSPSGVVVTVAIAPFTEPRALAADGAGNVYLPEIGRHVIWRIAPGGQSSIFAGMPGQTGSADGTGAAARFNLPAAIAVDASGNVYVADSANHTIRKITPGGVVSTLAGRPGVAGGQDGGIADATFTFPNRLSFDAAGFLVVLDTDASETPGHNRLRRINPAGVVSTWPSEAGTIRGAVGGLAVAPNGNVVYYTDWFNDVVRRTGPNLDPSGDFAGTSAFSLHLDGVGASAFFENAASAAVDAQGNLFVADAELVRKITPGGQVTTFAGGYVDALTIDAGGNLYAANANCFTPPRGTTTCTGVLRRIASDGMTSAITPASSSDGTGVALERPTGIAVDAAGNVYIADAGRGVIRKLAPGGDMTTFATGFGGLGDIALDRAGNLIVADAHAIHRIASGGLKTTIAGAPGVPGFADGQGDAARFNFPGGVVVDSGGNVYVADSLNFVVRKVTPAGVVTTVAGTPGVQGFHPGPLPGVIGYAPRLAMNGRNLYIPMVSIVAIARDVP